MINLSEFKKFFLYISIGALAISALVAVITVLFGEFNETTSKVFYTLGMVIIHSLISLGFIWENEKKGTLDNLSFFTNVLFFIIVLSFITSILGIWEIFYGDLVSKIYSTFFVFGFAALHGNILAKALHKARYIDNMIYINYIFMAIVVAMLLPIIYIKESFDVLGEFYFRLLGASGIIDGTLSILTIIFYKLYLHKHPKEVNLLQAGKSTEKKKGLSIWVWILIIYLVLQVISFLFGMIFYKF